MVDRFGSRTQTVKGYKSTAQYEYKQSSYVS